jgi:uncharacterized membrane protein YphA (DoxX/SURF4 family)
MIDMTFVALRIAVATILIWGGFTKLVDADRMSHIAAVWNAGGIPQPELLVAASVGLQLILAALLLVGLFTRTAGLLGGLNFVVAAAISGVFASPHSWAFVLLIALLLHFAIAGPGPLSIDRRMGRKYASAPPAPNGSLEQLLTSMGFQARSDDGNYPAGKD